MKLLIVGQNPAKGFDGCKAFVGTKSGDVLFGWLKAAGFDHKVHLDLFNLHDRSGRLPSSRKLKQEAAYIAMMGSISRPDGIILVGRVAHRYMMPHIKFTPVITVPHPSGLNRLLNSKRSRDKVVKDLQNFKRRIL